MRVNLTKPDRTVSMILEEEATGIEPPFAPFPGGLVMTHKLIIRNLRDCVAECTCGGWHFFRPTSDRDSESELRARIDSEFLQHQRRPSPSDSEP